MANDNLGTMKDKVAIITVEAVASVATRLSIWLGAESTSVFTGLTTW